MLLKAGTPVKIFFNPQDQIGYEGTAVVLEDPRNDYSEKTKLHFSRVRFMGEKETAWRIFHDRSIIILPPHM